MSCSTATKEGMEIGFPGQLYRLEVLEGCTIIICIGELRSSAHRLEGSYRASCQLDLELFPHYFLNDHTHVYDSHVYTQCIQRFHIYTMVHRRFDVLPGALRFR